MAITAAGVFGGAASAFQVPDSKPFHSGFVERWYVEQTWDAFVGCNCKDAGLVGLMQFDRRSKLHENEIDMAGDDVVQGRGSAFVRHVHQFVPVTRSNRAAVRCDVVPMPCEA